MPIIKSGAFWPWSRVSGTYKGLASMAEIYADLGDKVSAEAYRKMAEPFLEMLSSDDCPQKFQQPEENFK